MACPFRPGAWLSWPTSWSPRGVVDDINHEGLRILLREEGVSFQRVKTWKASRDPDYATKKARVEHLYAIADGEVIPEPGDPEVVFALTSSDRSTLSPAPGGTGPSAAASTRTRWGNPGPRRRATYARPYGVRHLFAAYDLGSDKLYGHIRKTKNRSKFLEFCRYLRSRYPADVRIALLCDNFAPHLTTKRCRRMADWAGANNVAQPGHRTGCSLANQETMAVASVSRLAAAGSGLRASGCGELGRVCVAGKFSASRVRRPPGARPATNDRASRSGAAGPAVRDWGAGWEQPGALKVTSALVV